MWICNVVRQMQEKFRAKGKKLYFRFVDLEKAFDRVPREVISIGGTTPKFLGGPNLRPTTDVIQARSYG